MKPIETTHAGLGLHPLSDEIQAGLSLLWKARNYSQQARTSVWNFAIGIHELRALGMETPELRWLVARGYAEQAWEVEAEGKDRQFQNGHPFRFSDESCFVLTPSGTDLLRKANDGLGLFPRPSVHDLNGDSKSDTDAPLQLKPHWDPVRRELRWNSATVKRFRVPAPNQERILNAFQEESWPPRIDDPLPSDPEITAKRKLHATIASLNRCQPERLIRFRGDGQGVGVLWEVIRTAAPNATDR